MVERLAATLLEKFGAPDLAAARAAAEEEVAFAASLCDHAPQTLLAVQRSVEDGEIRERFRTLRPREAAGSADSLHAHSQRLYLSRGGGRGSAGRTGRFDGTDRG